MYNGDRELTTMTAVQTAEKGDYMRNKKRWVSLFIIGLSAMCLMNGCKKKSPETEAPTETAAPVTEAPDTEPVKNTYTSESSSFSIDLPDTSWVATKEGIENKWAFMKEGVGSIQITHKRSRIKAKKLPESQEQAIALLNKIKENAFENVEYKKDSTDSADLYYYAASTQDTELSYVYLVKYIVNTNTESYTLTAQLTADDADQIQAVKNAVTSFKVLQDDSKTAESSDTADTGSESKSDSDKASSAENESGSSGNSGAEGTSSVGTDEEYRYFFDADGNTIYTYPSEDGKWRDENGTAYIFYESGVEDTNGNKFYYDPPQSGASQSGSSELSSDDYVDFYDSKGNYIKATQDENGNWVGSDGKTYTLSEEGVTDSDGNFSKW